MQKSRCSTSSCCCFFSSATILSISALTLVKASSCARIASIARAGAPDLEAPRRSTAITFWRRCCSSALSDFTWTKLVVLSKFAKAASSLRILIVSSTASISVMRSFTRWSNSVSLAAHLSWSVARNCWSRASCSWVCSRSLKAVACLDFRSAISSSRETTMALPLSISSSLAARRAWNSVTACASLAFASERSFSKSSFICERMPVIWPLCGA
mmetsp:Transcript_54664/g.160790  ORF Transcript_54664/g.160790 Transcript_54664/m.160790 type:complete len:214 (-) Transcript_54664:514-1155(-)